MPYPFERLDRDRGPVKGHVFVVMPYGKREFVNDSDEIIVTDFDQLYEDHYVPVIESLGMTPVRADSLYSDETILGNVWCGLQEGDVVVVELTGSNRNVMIEFGWAYLLGKKLIPLTQCRKDLPSDLPGLRYIHYSPLIKDMRRMEEELARQLKVLAEEKGSERRLVPLETSTIRPATAKVVSTAREYAVVEAEKGQRCLLAPEDVEWGRILGDMTHRFSVGDVLNGAFETTEDGYTRYTLLAGQTNPWHAVAAEFPEGRTFSGKVVNFIDNLGAFIRVGHGVNGLVPASSLRGCGPVDIGTELKVGVARLDVPGRKILLRPLTGGGNGRRGLPAAPQVAGPPMAAPGALPQIGDRADAEVCRVVPENGRSGGFALVMLPGGQRAMLHCTQMLPDLREDLNSGELQAGDLVYIEVIKVDAGRGKVEVRDLGDPPADLATAA